MNLVSRLDKLIAQFCPDGVEYVTLGDILKNNNAPSCISKKNYKDTGSIPIIDQSQSYIAGYTEDASAIPPVLPCIVFGDHTRVVKYADQKFAQGYSGTKVLIPIADTINVKYVYYVFCNSNIPSRGYNRHWIIAKDIKIPLPPPPIQEEIVRILDNFTGLTAELTAELTAREKQYEHYRDKLLTFGDSVPKFALGDITVRTKGTKITAQQMKQLHKEKGEVRIFAGGKTFADVNFEDIPGKDINFKPSIIVKSRGNIEFEYYEKPFSHKNEFWSYYSENNKVNIKFIYYYLINNVGYFQHIANNMQMPQISIPVTDKYKIPIPPLAEQERIVSILDRFDVLCNDLTSGLPAEIEARQKQYEYYRDKLLTFPTCSADRPVRPAGRKGAKA